MNKIKGLALAGALLAAAAMTALAATPAIARTEDFVGRWVNVDRDTNGITRVEVWRDGWRLWVRVWGQCRPRDCDWGQTEGHVYARTSGGDRSDAVAVSANLNAGFARKYIVLRLSRGGNLRLESFTNFDDYSHRSDYFIDATLRHPWEGWSGGWAGRYDDRWSRDYDDGDSDRGPGGHDGDRGRGSGDDHDGPH